LESPVLRDKTAILAYLKKLRKTDTARSWKLSAFGLGSAICMAAAVAVVPNQIDASLHSEVLVHQLGAPALTLAANDDRPFLREDRVLRGETLAASLRRLGVSDSAVLAQCSNKAISRELGGDFHPNTIVTVATSADGRLQSASFLREGSDGATVLELQDGQLTVHHQALELERRIHMQAGVIQSTLFAATDAAGLPDSVAEELARMFGNEIDFQDDLKKGDQFSIVYEVYYHHGQAVRAGKILAAEFVNQGKRHAAFLFHQDNGKEAYYGRDGKSLTEGFLRSPLEYSRVTSGFSMRLHPILGIWREHKGVDFGAPSGTSVRATADGTVEFAGWQTGYGNFIVLRHGDKYSTAYGHLSAFADRLRKGDHVAQGATIGYVGATGWATGPHLHYEFRINNVCQDPLTVSLSDLTPLTPQSFGAFRRETNVLAEQLRTAQRLSTARLD
jgi:murein DD-endopeptidase MepM/ murein hydrolase activator NlpD